MFSDVDSDSDDSDEDDLSGEGEDDKPKAGRPTGPIAPRYVYDHGNKLQIYVCFHIFAEGSWVICSGAMTRTPTVWTTPNPT